jgi:superfamily II DNA or RNA helicase
MKKNIPGQITLSLPFHFNIELKAPLFYVHQRHKYGVLSQLALPSGVHELEATLLDGNRYKIVAPEANCFIADLSYYRGIYKLSGFAEAITFDEEKIKTDLRINGEGKNGEKLRKAQTGSVFSLLGYWTLSSAPCSVVLPTGTGKTETMLVTSLAADAKRTLVIVPGIDLKHQTADKYYNWGMLRRLGVISFATPNPKVLVLGHTLTDPAFADTITLADVVITTPAFVARSSMGMKEKLKTLFSHVFFDEAHHIQASEWSALKVLFSGARIVQFTATPYRNDKKPIEGKIVYNYPLSQALTDEVFSRISLISVDERHPQKKDYAIAHAAMARLQEDREKGYKRHKMMVRADKITHARALFANYKEWFPNERITIINSDTKERKKLIEKIKAGEFDIIICVDMLKEGFDFPDFKIAAVHRLHQSLGVLLQFIGRFTRTQSGLGDASFVVNFADENISLDLENLLQEGYGWENVISEVADAKKREAESLLAFLQGCEPYASFDSPDIELHPKLVYPALSCVCYKCDEVDWANFRYVFNLNKYALSQPYFNRDENVFYFTTQKRERVKWAKTNKISDQTWNLIVMHWDKKSKILYIHHSDKSLDTPVLVKWLSGRDAQALNGDCVFRSFDSIKRLSIVHAGLFKPANHLHRYSRFSGADVTTELKKWKDGHKVKKSDFVGIGFRSGEPVSVGASVKGKIWSPARIGDLKQWKTWCLGMGKLITDEKIDANQLLADSAEKIQLSEYPIDLIVLATDWNETLYDRMHKLVIRGKGIDAIMLSECTISAIEVDRLKANLKIRILEIEIGFSITLGGENGHIVEGLDNSKITIEGLKSDPIAIKQFFEENPPTLFLINGCTISGCIQTNFNLADAAGQVIPAARIESLLWEKVIFTRESMYKKGQSRENSVQEYMMRRLVERGAKIVFNDDNSGESADIIAVFQEAGLIRFELVHCKYSKEKAGSRINDLFEVSGQAIVSLRYKWKPEELLKHMDRRNGTGTLKGKRYYYGDKQDNEQIRKALRYTNVSFEFAIAQPGVTSSALNTDMMGFLGSIYATVIEMTETELKCYFS